jgi:predicted phosphoadenosine phosphosulfate sulfurtransferase
VWKYIHDNNIKYNEVYNEMYRHGVKVNDMRISNLHHETAIQALLLVQEIEPETWLKIVDRIDGANTIKHIKKNSFVCPKELPYMFKDWEEYALHLAKNIVQEDIYRDQLMKKINDLRELYSGNDMIVRGFWTTIINTILSSDWDFTKLKNWEINGDAYTYRKFRKGKRDKKMLNGTKYMSKEQIQELINDIQNGNSTNA